jgi:multiple sugar transport system substrate-binding protein
MPTIKDIAKAAGVSQGTVSNVLSGKGNVSSEKIKHVQDVAFALGYTPNERAKNLRKGASNLLAAIVPNINSKQYMEFYVSFKNYAESHNYAAQLYITNDNPEAEQSVLNEIKSSMAAGVAAISCSSTADNIYRDLGYEDNYNIIFVERDPGFTCSYIGFDYSKAGAYLAGCALEKNYTSIGLITGDLNRSNEAAFYNSFMQTIGKNKCIVNHIQTDHYRKNHNILQMLNGASLQALFVSNYGFAENVKDINQSFNSGNNTKIYTVSPIFTMPENDFIKYELNYRYLGIIAAEALIKVAEKKEVKFPILLDNTGYRNWFPNIKFKEESEPINVLTIDSPEAYTMKSLSRMYTQKTGIDVNITVYSYDEMYEAFTNMSESSVFDVIRLDVTWLSWFAEKILQPLDQLDSNIASLFNQFLDGVVERYSIINNRIYTLPSTPSMMLLYYRKDLFNSSVLKRIYYEKYKCELLPPTSIEEFNRIARFFTKAYNPSSPTDYGATLTLGSTGVAASEFLARYFSYNQNLYDDNNVIKLNSDIALKCLTELTELKNYSNENYNTWWTDTAASFAEGNTAMTILYSNYASDLLRNNSRVVGNIGYTLVPGNNPLIGGGSLGVSKFSKHPEAALQFIKWMCSEPITTASTALGSVSPCKNTYDNYEIVDVFPWLNLVKDCFVLSHCRRIPSTINKPFDERRFLGIVGMAVKNSYSGAMKPKEALDLAQEQFVKQFDYLYLS